MTRLSKWLMAGTLLFCSAAAVAAEPDVKDMQTTINALRAKMRDQGNRLAELEDQQAAQKASMVQIAKEMADSASSKPCCPGWLENLKFYGDLRLRYQGNCYDWAANDGSDRKSRNRGRYRVRFGFTKTWLDDQIEVGFRLATGESSDPTSTNQSMDGNFSKKDIWLDLAYAKYKPKQCKGFSITAGKMKNPWMMNDVFMDTDVNPEGVWAAYTVPGCGDIEPFVGAGYFVLEERSATSSPVDDTIMYGYQAGLNWKISDDVKYTFAAYYQDYDHYNDSGASARGNDSPLDRIPGFGVFGVTNKVGFTICKVPTSVFFDWAHNCREADDTAEYEDDCNAYAVGFKLGKNKKKGDWSFKYTYAIVEANALPGTFVDADFGFANRRGHVVRGAYNLLDNLTFGLNVFFTEPIFSPTTNSNSSVFEDKTTIVQADLKWKF